MNVPDKGILQRSLERDNRPFWVTGLIWSRSVVMMETQGDMPLLERVQRERLRMALDEAVGRRTTGAGDRRGRVGKTRGRAGVHGNVRRDGSCEQLFTARPLGPPADIASKAGGSSAVLAGRAGARGACSPRRTTNDLTLTVIEDALGRRGHVGRDRCCAPVASTCSLVIVTRRDELSSTIRARRVRVIPRLLDRAARVSFAADGCESRYRSLDAVELFQRTGQSVLRHWVLATGCIELPPLVRDARSPPPDQGARTRWRPSRPSPGPFRCHSFQPWVLCRSARRMPCVGDVGESEASPGHDPARRSPTRSSHFAGFTARHCLNCFAPREPLSSHHAEATRDAEAVAVFAPIAAAEAAGRGRIERPPGNTAERCDSPATSPPSGARSCSSGTRPTSPTS